MLKRFRSSDFGGSSERHFAPTSTVFAVIAKNKNPSSPSWIFCDFVFGDYRDPYGPNSEGISLLHIFP